MTGDYHERPPGDCGTEHDRGRHSGHPGLWADARLAPPTGGSSPLARRARQADRPAGAARRCDGALRRRVAIESRDGGRDLARAGDVSGGQALFASLADPRAHDAHPFGNVEDEPQAASSADDEAGTLASWHSLSTTGVDLVRRHGNAALTAIVLAWIVGLGLCGAIALRRIIRFDRMIRGTLAAPQRWQAMVAELAGKLGVRRVPDLRLIDGDGVPMVWWVGRRPIIALPAGLMGELDDQQTSMVLAHELAHLRRRDHWVRGAELVISVLYWWNPMVGWVRRQTP